MKRTLVAAIALMAVVLIQLTIVNGLPLPGGGTPDLVLLCVIAFGMARGPASGLIAGFCAGLALDLAPPASQLLGQYALVLCLVGYGAGKLRFTLQHSVALALCAAAAMAALGEAMAAGLALLLGTPDVSWASVAHVLPPSVFLDILVSPLTLSVCVRLAVALGIPVSAPDDLPVLETGGSAAPVTVPAGPAGAARADGARIYVRIGGMPRRGHRWAAGDDSLAAATGRWLVGDVAEAAPAIGAVGWLAGPTRSRRARREQARLAAMLTGASRRKGAFWVGRRPPGLQPVAPVVRRSARGLARLRPGGGVAGSAIAIQRQAQTGLARPGRAIHLGLAAEQRRRARQASRPTRVTGLAAVASEAGGPRRFAVTGVLGPDVPRIAFGSGGLPGVSRAARRPVPRIAFGSGRLPGVSPAARRPVPKIAFGSGLRGSAARPGLSRVAAPGFGAGPARFAAGSWLASSTAGRGGPQPRVASDSAMTASASSAPGPRGGNYRGSYQLGTGYHGRTARSVRRRRQPNFARGTAGLRARPSRQPKTARMIAGHGAFRRLRWMRRAGGRSAVWCIGSARMSGLR